MEFEVFRAWKGIHGRRLLVAVSGGRDSVALWALLVRLRARLGLELAIAHVHHGPAADQQQEGARQAALDFVRHLADLDGAPFFSQRSAEDLGQGEEGLRDFRLKALEELRTTHGYDWIVLAHHRDDLMETRLLRLIRGTGPEGFAAMRRTDGHWLRPLLAISRVRLEAYANERSLQWIEDPSNASSGPLRNWLRLDWLPTLQAKRPGAIESLTRSLELVAEALDSESEESRFRIQLCAACLIENGIDRRMFDTLGSREKNFVLAHYLRRIKARGFGRSQVEEIAKRLDTDQKSFSFKVGKFHWVINAEQIGAHE